MKIYKINQTWRLKYVSTIAATDYDLGFVFVNVNHKMPTMHRQQYPFPTMNNLFSKLVKCITYGVTRTRDPSLSSPSITIDLEELNIFQLIWDFISGEIDILFVKVSFRNSLDQFLKWFSNKWSHSDT